MPFSRYEPKTRVPQERVVLRSPQFSKWVAKRVGVSHVALNRALNIINRGIIEALAEGFDVNLFQVGTFELRELAPRKRYNKLKNVMYICNPSTMVHFKKSATLSERVTKLAAERLANVVSQPSVKPLSK